MHGVSIPMWQTQSAGPVELLTWVCCWLWTLCHTTQHGAVLIIFPLNLQTVLGLGLYCIVITHCITEHIMWMLYCDNSCWDCWLHTSCSSCNCQVPRRLTSQHPTPPPPSHLDAACVVTTNNDNMKVIRSRSRSQERKKDRHCVFPRRKTVLDNDPIQSLKIPSPITPFISSGEVCAQHSIGFRL